MSETEATGQAETPPEITVVDGGAPPPVEAPVEAPEEEPKAAAAPVVPVDKMLERVARAKRQRDEAAEESYLKDGQISELREIVGKLRGGGLKQEDFPTLAAYETAKAELEERIGRVTADRPRDAITPAMQADVAQAVKDLKYDIRRTDPGLWAEITAKEGEGEAARDKYTIGPHMVLAFADADDSVAALRAFMALPEEDRLEIAELSPRAQRKEIMRLAAKGAPAQQAQRDPSTGQFVKRQSAMDAPPEPVSGSSAAQVPIEKLALADDAGSFIDRRNAEEKQSSSKFGWR